MTNIRFYDNDYTDSEGYILSIYIRLDKEFDIYDRKVGNLITLLSVLGGLQKALFAIGALFVQFVVSKIFISKIVHKIYQIRKPTRELRADNEEDEDLEGGIDEGIYGDASQRKAMNDLAKLGDDDESINKDDGVGEQE